jgi:hypothetical protein
MALLRRLVLYAAGSMTASLGGFLFYLGVREISDARRLEGRGALTLAVVTAERGGRPGEIDEIRYRFSVGGESYSHSDATGRGDLWASVALRDHKAGAAWAADSLERLVTVRYLPEDPWINRPDGCGGRFSEAHFDAEGRSSMGDHIAGLALGLVLALAGVWLTLRVASARAG